MEVAALTVATNRPQDGRIIDMKFDRVRAALMQVCDPGRHCFVVFMVHGSSFTMFESGAICYDKNEKLAKDKHVLFALQKVHPTE